MLTNLTPDQIEFCLANYHYRVLYLNDEDAFKGICEEFPGLSYTDEKSNSSALNWVKALVREEVMDLISNGEPIPSIIIER